MLVTFTYPLALLSALGLVLPILLHLWHKRSNKVLVIGSVRYLKEGKRQRIQKWYIRNWPLFLLRCALLLCLSLLLSEPKLALPLTTSSSKGWVLLGRDYESRLTESQQREIDSLLAKGYELRTFDKRFAVLEKTKSDSVERVANDLDLIRLLDKRLPSGFPVRLYTSRKVGQVRGDIPALSVSVQWQAFGLPDTTVNQWVQKAWQTEQDSIKLLIATSRSANTYFHIITLAQDGRTQGLLFTTEGGIPKVKFPKQAYWVIVDTKPYQVQLAAATNLLDKTYVEAFIKAFSAFTAIPIRITEYQQGVKCDFLFNLTGEEALPTKQAARVFNYAKGNAETQKGFNKILYAGFRSNKIAPDLYRLIPGNNSEDALWTDVFDRPVLTYSRQAGQALFQFYSRFNPQWTNLIWSDELVNGLLPLFFSQDPVSPVFEEQNVHPADQRVYTGTLALPRKAEEGASGERMDFRELSTWFLWLALLLFVIERVWTYQSRKEENDGTVIG